MIFVLDSDLEGIPGGISVVPPPYLQSFCMMFCTALSLWGSLHVLFAHCTDFPPVPGQSGCPECTSALVVHQL